MAKDVKAANQTRAQKAKAAHQKATKERASDAKAVKAIYLTEKEGPLLEDILKKATGFMKYHLKIAQDGVGSRKTGEKYENGTDVFEVYYLNPAERATHLDKAAGLQELVDYIERQTNVNDPTTAVVKPKKEDAVQN